ncbi:LuxR family transcriptional regulator [Flavihumibacter solisilvae]|uniref:LuxR family transcriptional regulator n=2 Tax=Flavihumibacter solisilvae TaxID=1349421 RepID=A0A0C1IYH7_9BACT|nr:LuxR family transcriptional regulator [Flavihumibacter solisilvae]
MKIRVGIADDQQLFLRSLSLLINSFDAFSVVLEALNGEEIIRQLGLISTPPDLLLIDVNMPIKGGAETTMEIQDKYPLVKPIALSMKDDDQTIIKMIRAGCCAYLIKDINPEDLEKALLEVYETGIYNGDVYNMNHRRLSKLSNLNEIQLSGRELEFLKLSSTDLTYRQIAVKMNLAERTVDGYREALFEKLKVQSRVGMIVEAIKKELIIV